MPSWRTRAARARYGQSTRRRRRARRRRLLLLGLLLVLGWLGIAAVLLALAASDARAANDHLSQVRGGRTAADLLRGDGREQLERAGRELRSASGRASSPIVAPLRYLPVVGRQVQSFRSLASTSSDVVDVGLDALEETQGELEGTLPTGPARVELLGSLQATLDQSRARLFRSIGLLGPGEGLIQPLADARNDLVTELGEFDNILGRTHDVVVALRSFLDGDGRYLVLASNNAEMQAGWGMPLQAGVLTVDDGEVDLPDLQPTADMLLPTGVPLEGDLAANWASFQPNREWRNLALTPRFTESAPLAAAMWEARGGGPVDGVLAVDPYALRAVLRATGPVSVNGDPVSADRVVPFVLHDQYIDQSIDDPGRAERQDRLSDVASAAVEALGGDVDALTLAEELMKASYQRHVLAWSSVEEEQKGWESSGVDGELEPDSALVGLINRGCNKLDWFLDVSATLEVEAVPDGREGVLRVAVDNRTPTGQSSYIAGPQPRCGVTAAGDWLGIVTANLPSDVGTATADGGALLLDGTDGATRLLGANLAVPRGAHADLVFRFEVSTNLRSVQVEPSARARPVRWRVAGRSWGDDRQRTVTVGDDRR